jgi:cell wall-associated NlpC family hydrolase
MTGDILDHPIETPAGDLPIIPVALMLGGAYLAWFGVYYWGSDTRWPTDPIKSLLTGNGIPAPDRSARADAILTPAQSAAALAAGGSALAQAGSQVFPNAPTGPVAGPVAPGSRSAIATYAQRYVGQGYVWGGPADRPGNWDCSSFTSYVLGHDNGLRLPGGGKYGDPGYPPHDHGPTTVEYQLFGQPLIASQVGPGDLIVSSTHMGIAVSSTEYVSALNPSAGTKIENWTVGFPGGPPIFRRVA